MRMATMATEMATITSAEAKSHSLIVTSVTGGREKTQCPSQTTLFPLVLVLKLLYRHINRFNIDCARRRQAVKMSLLDL